MKLRAFALIVTVFFASCGKDGDRVPKTRGGDGGGDGDNLPGSVVGESWVSLAGDGADIYAGNMELAFPDPSNCYLSFIDRDSIAFLGYDQTAYPTVELFASSSPSNHLLTAHLRGDTLGLYRIEGGNELFCKNFIRKREFDL